MQSGITSLPQNLNQASILHPHPMLRQTQSRTMDLYFYPANFVGVETMSHNRNSPRLIKVHGFQQPTRMSDAIRSFSYDSPGLHIRHCLLSES